MANDFSPTKRERDWVREFEGFVRRGDTGGMIAHLDRVEQEQPHLRPRFIRHAMMYIVQAPHNKPAKKKRAELLQAYLDHPQAPVPDEPVLRQGQVSACLQGNHLNLIPILHAAGFRAKPTSEDYERAATHIQEGRWPHAELILPNILQHGDVAWKIAGGIFTSKMKVEHIDKLCTLTPGKPFIKAASRGLVRHMGDKRDPWEAKPEAGAMVGRLLQAGLIDAGEVHKEAHEHDGKVQQAVGEIMARGEQWQLHKHTPAASGTRRMRL